MAFEKKVMMIVVAIAVMLVSTHGQVDPSSMSCVQALMPCLEFINATKPPATCCDPIKEAFETQLTCLCSLFENPELAAASNINMTQAMELPVKCGVEKADPSVCKKEHVGAPTEAPIAGGKPTTSFDESSPSPGSSAANSVTRAGPISSLMLLLAGVMVYY